MTSRSAPWVPTSSRMTSATGRPFDGTSCVSTAIPCSARVAARVDRGVLARSCERRSASTVSTVALLAVRRNGEGVVDGPARLAAAVPGDQRVVADLLPRPGLGDQQHRDAGDQQQVFGRPAPGRPGGPGVGRRRSGRCEGPATRRRRPGSRARPPGTRRRRRTPPTGRPPGGRRSALPLGLQPTVLQTRPRSPSSPRTKSSAEWRRRRESPWTPTRCAL